MNVVIMFGQSKMCYQVEIDLVCEFIDFLCFNVCFVYEIEQMQFLNVLGVCNCSEYWLLEGFVYVVMFFNFMVIGGNLVIVLVFMGNIVLWKLVVIVVLLNYFFMELLEVVGLLLGVINFVLGDLVQVSNVVLSYLVLVGVYFIGLMVVFDGMWLEVGCNILCYWVYLCLVGEIGGKDFVLVYCLVDVDVLVVVLVCGVFEYQGQKCSVVLCVYIFVLFWLVVKMCIVVMVKLIKMGDVCDFGNFMGVVIDKCVFDCICSYIYCVCEDV